MEKSKSKGKSLLLDQAPVHFGAVAPTYIPEIGIANVTQATAFPPLPPTLNPNADYQPMDTALGDYIMKQFVVAPTVTPPPLQSALNVAYGCPILELPARLWISAPTGCSNTRTGIWADTNGEMLSTWNESCVALADADVTYILPSGDKMGSSYTHLDMNSDIVELFGCDLTSLYRFTEKIYKRTGAFNQDVCDKYGVCDSEIYLQYFIHGSNGALAAQTGYLAYFQDSFDLLDPAFVPIATITRNGAWSPKDECPTYKKEWIVQFGGSGSPLTGVPNRWIVAAFTSVMTLHDADRDLTGMIRGGQCQRVAWTTLFITSVVLIVLTVVIVIVVWLYFLDPLRSFFFKLEDTIFPAVMNKPSKFDP